MSNIPASKELEDGCLGCILANPSESVNALMSHYSAGAKLFFDQRNRLIFERLADMVDENLPVDEVTLCDFIQKKNELNKVGGIVALSALWGNATSAHNLKYYADQLNDLHVSRELLHVGQRLVKLGVERAGVAGLDEAEREVLAIGSQNRVGDDSSIKRAVKTVVVRLQERFEGKHVETGLMTGLADLDNTLHGLKPGQLIIIAARPSKGKTALAMQMAQTIALHSGAGVGVFSLEMAKEELAERMIAVESEVDLGRLQGMTMADFDKISKASVAIAGSGIRINERGGISVSALRAAARRMVQRHHVKLLVVDYIQLMVGSTRENRTQEVSEISRGLKALAKELVVPVIALSQLNRQSESEGREPRLSDLRESGSIEQDADVVIMIHQKESEMSAGQVPVELLVQKHRNGRTGRVEVWFVPSITKFRSKSHGEKN
jgi:replicative DNA helicase